MLARVDENGGTIGRAHDYGLGPNTLYQATESEKTRQYHPAIRQRFHMLPLFLECAVIQLPACCLIETLESWRLNE
jgi:hypothetical protein